MKTGRKRVFSILIASAMLAALVLQGCGTKEKSSGKIEIEIVQYKQEAVKVFEELAEEFNATHDEIHLTIDSPNEAMVILKTRLVREDEPDIIGIGGDINYSYFLDSDILADISDFEGIKEIKPAYMDILNGLEFVPEEGMQSLQMRMMKFHRKCWNSCLMGRKIHLHMDTMMRVQHLQMENLRCSQLEVMRCHRSNL